MPQIFTGSHFGVDVSRGWYYPRAFSYFVAGHIDRFGPEAPDGVTMQNDADVTHILPATTPAPVTLVSDSSSDTLAGGGAFAVLIQGVNSDQFIEIELVFLNGTTPVQSTKSYYCVNRADSVQGPLGQQGTIKVSIGGQSQGALLAHLRSLLTTHVLVPKNYVYFPTLMYGSGTLTVQQRSFVVPNVFLGNTQGNVGNVFHVNQQASSLPFYTEFPFPGGTYVRMDVIGPEWGAASFYIEGVMVHESQVLAHGHALTAPPGFIYDRVSIYGSAAVWTSRTSAADNSWRSVVWAAALEIFAAVSENGTGNRVMTSPDGITWTSRTSAADNSWRAIAWSPELNLFAAVSETGVGNRVMTSPDGITWTSRTSASDTEWRGIAWSPALGLFAAVSESGTGNRVMTSSDGLTWTSRTSAADNDWQSIAWSPALNLFAAVAETGTGNRVMTSPDGITWTIRTSAADNTWRSIAWSPELNLFAAVSQSGTGNRVMTSPDGIAWTSRTSAADNGWYSIAWSPALGVFVAVAITGTGNRVMTSPDGIAWTLRTSAANNSWRSVAWSPALGLFAAVSSTGTGNRVMTSS